MFHVERLTASLGCFDKGRAPFSAAFLFAKGPQVSAITGNTVIMDVLLIRHVIHMGTTADTERSFRALGDILDRDFLSR
jgi:hypothetical protein